ncbi:MAG TPA: Holliday junction branch migration protein RuvA [Longimicrobiales bacterium]
MISRLRGRLITRDMDRVEVETAGGVVYEVEVPLMILQRLPSTGSEIELRTLQVVREDSVTLYGFLDVGERVLFKRLMTAKGVGAKMAASLLSVFTAPRLVRALVEKDVTALTQVSGVGKKKAELIALELSDRVTDLAVGVEDAPDSPRVRMARAAVQALVSLGYTFPKADEAVGAALEGPEPTSTEELVRRALKGA